MLNSNGRPAGRGRMIAERNLHCASILPHINQTSTKKSRDLGARGCGLVVELSLVCWGTRVPAPAPLKTEKNKRISDPTKSPFSKRWPSTPQLSDWMFYFLGVKDSRHCHKGKEIAVRFLFPEGVLNVQVPTPPPKHYSGTSKAKCWWVYTVWQFYFLGGKNYLSFADFFLLLLTSFISLSMKGRGQQEVAANLAAHSGEPHLCLHRRNGSQEKCSYRRSLPETPSAK